MLSFPTTLSVPSHSLSPPAHTFPSNSPLTCHQTTPSSYTLITCWPTYYTNYTQPQSPAIPDISTLLYNRNIPPKHTQGPQSQMPLYCFPHSPTPLPASPFSATLSNSQISIASLANVNLPTPACRYYHQGVLYIVYKLLIGYWPCELVIAKLYLQTRDRNSTPT
jgi:hypothetical protein